MTPIRGQVNTTPEAAPRFINFQTLYQQIRNIFQRSSPVSPYLDPVMAPRLARPQELLLNRDPDSILQAFGAAWNETVDRRLEELTHGAGTTVIDDSSIASDGSS